MRRAIRILVVGLFALSVVVPAAPLATASTGVSVASAGVSVAAVDQPPTTTAPAGPNLNPDQAPNKSRQKLVIGVFAAILLVIVFLGRRSRNKRRKKAAKATVT